MNKKITIMKSCLLLTVLCSLLFVKGGVSYATETNINTPGIAVVDKRGVGQTENEVKNGMNANVVYDQTSNTLSWNIGKGYELVEDYTYYITFCVKDGQIAREECRVSR